MYKDKNKQRKANREANKRYRERTQGITPEPTMGITPPDSVAVGITPETAPITQNTDEHEAAQRTISYRPELTLSEFFKALKRLPAEPTRPTGAPNPGTAKLTAGQLHTRIRYYHGLDWITSPEYAEIIFRLLTHTIEQLEADHQSIPAWRLRQEPTQATPVDESKVELQC